MNRKTHTVPDRSALLPPLPNLESALAALVAQIPAGKVATCGAIAEALGFRGAAVWVAQWSANHDHHADCRCHRIVRASGEPGPFIAGPTAEKLTLLANEGVAIRRTMRGTSLVELGRFLFTEFQSDRPLAELIRVQLCTAAFRNPAPPRRPPQLIGGFDAAYRRDGTMQAAMVVCDALGAPRYRAVIRRPVSFPYISTLLAFRELPAYCELLERAWNEDLRPELLLVDGSGLLHPRGAGIAVHLGVWADLPSIGVSKTLLFGRYDSAGIRPGESRPIVVDGGTHGIAYRPSESSRKCLFISPGHRCDLAFAEYWVRRLIHDRRLPEPLADADRLSRAEDDDTLDQLPPHAVTTQPPCLFRPTRSKG